MTKRRKIPKTSRLARSANAATTPRKGKDRGQLPPKKDSIKTDSVTKDPVSQLEELFLIRVPPEPDRVDDLVTISTAWSESYQAWHGELQKEIHAAVLARYERLFQRVSRMKEADATSQLQSVMANRAALKDLEMHQPELKSVLDVVRNINSIANRIYKATDDYMAVLQDDLDPLFENYKQNTDNKLPDIRLKLAEALTSVLIPFSGELRRLCEGTGLILESLNEDVGQDIGSHVVIMARAGHSDAVIARVLGRAFPDWSSSALARVREEAGGGSAPLLEERRVQELLAERVRKMRTERNLPAGQAFRLGKEDPLAPLKDVILKEPEAEQ